MVFVFVWLMMEKRRDFGGPTSFFSYPTKIQFPQTGEKIGEKSEQNFLEKIARIFFFFF